MVVYKPGTGKYAELIGAFNQDSIQEHVDRFMRNQGRTWDTKVSENMMVLQSECAAKTAAPEQDSDFDDILAEILAEEEARKS